MTLKISSPKQSNSYSVMYMPFLLYPIPKAVSREEADIPMTPPFDGIDIWNAYEFSWLNLNGKPEIAMARIYFPCSAPNIIESKSLKLYLCSFSQSHFESPENVAEIIEKDLSETVGGKVTVEIFSKNKFSSITTGDLPGKCLDDLDIKTDTYHVNPQFLKTNGDVVEETLHSHLLKTNCPRTGHPDWGSVMIHYVGPKISHTNLLRYIISYRLRNVFAEYCIEEIFMDIWRRCRPDKLSVLGCYNRRGGLDICPFRSNFEKRPNLLRLPRQ